MRKQTFALGALGITVGLLATGCGSSSSRNSSARTSITVTMTSGEILAQECTSEAFSPPWVVGQERPSATKQLREAGLVVKTELKASAAPAGVVLNQFPPRYQKVCKGFPIILSVSGGPAPAAGTSPEARPVPPRRIAVTSVASAAGDSGGPHLSLRSVDQASAARATLRLTDFPSGWKVAASWPVNGTVVGAGCKRFHPDLSRQTVTGLSGRMFLRRDRARQVSSLVAVFRSREDAMHVFTADYTR